MASQEITFYLDISALELQRYYEGSATSVTVSAEDGRRIRFPVSALRPFVSHAGVKGWFVLLTDANNKLVELRRKPA